MEKLREAICFCLSLLLGLSIIGTFWSFNLIQAPSSIPPTSLTAIEMSMNASAYDWRARTKHVFNDTAYWMRWGFFDPVKMTGYENSLESEAIAQFFLFNVLLYNLTRDPMALERAIDSARTIDEEFQEDNPALGCYGGLWLEFNNITKEFDPWMNRAHTDMALVGMSLLYNLTGTARWKASVEAMAHFCFDSMYDDTAHQTYAKWDNSTQECVGATPYVTGWYAAAIGAYTKYVTYNATLEKRVDLHYSWQMKNNVFYTAGGQMYFHTKMEMHAYELYGALFCALAFNNSTYREIYTNGTEWIIGLMDANPSGNNGSLPFDYILSAIPTWNAPPTGLHGWASCQLLYHMSVAYSWTRNATILTYVNYLIENLKQTIKPNGYWNFTTGTGSYNHDNRTWSPASAVAVLGTVQHALETQPDYPFAVTSTTLIKDLAWFSGTNQLHFTAIDQWNEWNWFRYRQTYHQITLYCETSPMGIYQDGSKFESWTYSNNIVALNFTLTENTQFNIYFQALDTPHLIASEDAITSMTFADNVMKFTVNGGVRKNWSLGNNLFYDDFSKYATCTNGTPTWIPEGSYWHVTSDDQYHWNQTSGLGRSMINGSDYDNFRLDIDVKTCENNKWTAAVFWRIRDSSNYYRIAFHLRYDPHTFSLRQAKSGSLAILDEVTYDGTDGFPEALTWYHITLLARDNHFEVTVNGTKYFDVWDTWERQITLGNFSLYVLNPGGQRFDNINITKYDSTPIRYTTTIINCTSSYGKPQEVKNVYSYDFDEATNLLTIVTDHASPKEVTIDWRETVLYTLNVHVRKARLPLSGVSVTVNGEKKWTDPFGTATWELPYGHYTVKATVGKKTKTTHVLLNRNKVAGITFGKGKKG